MRTAELNSDGELAHPHYVVLRRQGLRLFQYVCRDPSTTTGTQRALTANEIIVVQLSCWICCCHTRALIDAVETAEERANVAEQALAREKRLRTKAEAELAKARVELMRRKSHVQARR